MENLGRESLSAEDMDESIIYRLNRLIFHDVHGVSQDPNLHRHQNLYQSYNNLLKGT